MTYRADEVIAEHGAALARIAASYERDRALREDLLQEIFLAIIASLPRLRDPSRLRPFLFRIAHNRAVRHIQERVRAPDSSVADSEAVASNEPAHEESMIAVEESEALLNAVRSLALPYRQVITLVLEGLSHPEIAETLGLSAGNVAVRVNRAKQRLRELLHHE